MPPQLVENLPQIVLVIVLVAVFIVLGRSGGMRRPPELEDDDGGEEVDSRQAKIESDKERVLELLADEREITNDDVQELLGVSDATATRRLHDLVEDEEIESVGRGKNTRYVLFGHADDDEDDEPEDEDEG